MKDGILFLEVDNVKTGQQENKTAMNADASTTSPPSASSQAENPTGSNIPPPPDPNRKGRYWNYEMNRWSYCSSEEDEENEDHVKGEKSKEKIEENKDVELQVNTDKTNNNTEERLNSTQKDIVDVRNNNSNKDKEGEEDDDYEWEYFYEDVEVIGNNAKEDTSKVLKTKSPIPKRLEGLVNLTAHNQSALGHVANEGVQKLAKGQSSQEVENRSELGPSGKTQKINPRDGWQCPTCTLLNEPKRPGCEACTTERPANYVIPPPGPADTIPRNTNILKPQVAANAATKNIIKEAPMLKVVAATVTKADQVAKAAVGSGGKVG